MPAPCRVAACSEEVRHDPTDHRHLRRAGWPLPSWSPPLWPPGCAVPLAVYLLQQSLTALASLDPQQVRGYIAAGGPQAALVSFALMILQAIVAPLPAFLITRRTPPCRAPSGAGRCRVQRHGWGRALLLHRQSAGARSGGVTTGRAVLRSADGYFTRFGPQTILLCRLLPFVPFDPVSYAAGLTSLRFWPFMLATGVGQLPATIVYSWAGSLLAGDTSGRSPGFRCFFALAVVISIAKNIYRERHKRLSP